MKKIPNLYSAFWIRTYRFVFVVELFRGLFFIQSFLSPVGLQRKNRFLSLHSDLIIPIHLALFLIVTDVLDCELESRKELFSPIVLSAPLYRFPVLDRCYKNGLNSFCDVNCKELDCFINDRHTGRIFFKLSFVYFYFYRLLMWFKETRGQATQPSGRLTQESWNF